jgi:hypothetical protein
MKYMLKSKRWSVLGFLYNHSRKFGTTDRVLFFDNEKDVLSFFNFALEEDIANATATMDTRYNGLQKLQTVMKISSASPTSFRKVLKNSFQYFRDITSGDDEHFRYWHTQSLNCNPRNYKLFTIEEKEVRGFKLKVIEHLSWFGFYKKCRANGMNDSELMFNPK